MAGISNSNFVLSSSRSGVLGSYGFAYQPPEKILLDIRQVMKENLMVNANFFIFSDQHKMNSLDMEHSLSRLKSSLPKSYSQVVSSPSLPYFPDLETQLEAIWETKPTCLSFHFGIPPEKVVEKAKNLGISIGMTATSSEEVEQVARAGADYVVLQGIEAGGHRGTFVPNDSHDEGLSSCELLARVRSSIRANYPSLQIVLAGGLMTRNSINHALTNGASAVQLGTIFIPSKESSASLEYKNAILGYSSSNLEAQIPATIYTNSWSGRKAQCIPNDFIKTLASLPGYEPLPFPLQNTVTQRIRDVAKMQKSSEYQSLYAGSCYSLCREVLYPTLNSSNNKGWKEENELLSVSEIIQKVWNTHIEYSHSTTTF